MSNQKRLDSTFETAKLDHIDPQSLSTVRQWKFRHVEHQVYKQFHTLYFSQCNASLTNVGSLYGSVECRNARVEIHIATTTQKSTLIWVAVHVGNYLLFFHSYQSKLIRYVMRHPTHLLACNNCHSQLRFLRNSSSKPHYYKARRRDSPMTPQK